MSQLVENLTQRLESLKENLTSVDFKNFDLLSGFEDKMANLIERVSPGFTALCSKITPAFSALFPSIFEGDITIDNVNDKTSEVLDFTNNIKDVVTGDKNISEMLGEYTVNNLSIDQMDELFKAVSAITSDNTIADIIKLGGQINAD